MTGALPPWTMRFNGKAAAHTALHATPPSTNSPQWPQEIQAPYFLVILPFPSLPASPAYASPVNLCCPTAYDW